MSEIPIEEQHHSHGITTLQDLTRELETLLDAFCSDAQQRFILEQQIASPQQLQRVRQTIHQIRNASSDLIQGPNSDAIRQSLMRVSLEMLDYYRFACHRHRLRHLPSGMPQQLTTDWHQLSQTFEHKAKEQANLANLYDRLGSLRKAWKKPRPIERLLTSLLATNFDLPPGAYLVAVDRHNYCQLGLKRKAIGTRQIIFDSTRISRKDQMDQVARVCDRFASVFARNAQHNLAQIEAQVQLAQLSQLAGKLRRLQNEIYDTDDDHPNSHSHDSDDDVDEVDTRRGRGESSAQVTDEMSSLDVTTDRHNSHSNGSMPEAHHHHPPPPPLHLQLSLQGASSLIYIQDQNIGLQNLPMPSFVPSPWEWADLLKVRRPYYPIFFGLIKRKRRSSSLSATTAVSTTTAAAAAPRKMRFWHLFSSKHMVPSSSSQQQVDNPCLSGEDAIPTTPARTDSVAEETFASVSFESLCSHFCRRGRQFYEDVAANAQIKQSQDRHLLQEIGHDLVKVYAAIQLEASRAYMHRILAILHDMTLLENQLLHSGSSVIAATTTAAAAASASRGSTSDHHQWQPSASQQKQPSEHEQPQVRSSSRVVSNASSSSSP